MTGLALAGGTTARRKNHGIAVCLTQTGNTGHPRARVATVRGGATALSRGADAATHRARDTLGRRATLAGRGAAGPRCGHGCGAPARASALC